MARQFANVPVAALIWLACMTLAQAADCPRKGTLGTSRILRVDAATYPRVGIKNFPQTLPLPLRDHEVVLTFDDGPWPPTTPKVLAMLAQECVRATFFLIGKPTSEHPELARRIAAARHTIGHHTWTHFSLMRMPQANAFDEIDHGIFRASKWRFTALRPQPRRRRSSAFRVLRRPRQPSISCNLAALSCSGPICGQRLGQNDAEAGIEALGRSAEGGPQGNHPAARPQGADCRHAAGFFALSQGQRLSRRAHSSRCARR